MNTFLVISAVVLFLLSCLAIHEIVQWIRFGTEFKKSLDEIIAKMDRFSSK